MGTIDKIVDNLVSMGEEKKTLATVRFNDFSQWLSHEFSLIRELISQESPRQSSDSIKVVENSLSAPIPSLSPEADRQKRKLPETGLQGSGASPDLKRNSFDFEDLAVAAGLPPDLNRLKKEDLIKEICQRGCSTSKKDLMKALKKDLIDILKGQLSEAANTNSSVSVPISSMQNHSEQELIVSKSSIDDGSAQIEKIEELDEQPPASDSVSTSTSVMDVRRSVLTGKSHSEMTSETDEERSLKAAKAWAKRTSQVRTSVCELKHSDTRVVDEASQSSENITEAQSSQVSESYSQQPMSFSPARKSTEASSEASPEAIIPGFLPTFNNFEHQSQPVSVGILQGSMDVSPEKLSGVQNENVKEDFIRSVHDSNNKDDSPDMNMIVSPVKKSDSSLTEHETSCQPTCDVEVDTEAIVTQALPASALESSTTTVDIAIDTRNRVNSESSVTSTASDCSTSIGGAQRVLTKKPVNLAAHTTSFLPTAIRKPQVSALEKAKKLREEEEAKMREKELERKKREVEKERLKKIREDEEKEKNKPTTKTGAFIRPILSNVSKLPVKQPTQTNAQPVAPAPSRTLISALKSMFSPSAKSKQSQPALVPENRFAEVGLGVPAQITQAAPVNSSVPIVEASTFVTSSSSIDSTQIATSPELAQTNVASLSESEISVVSNPDRPLQAVLPEVISDVPQSSVSGSAEDDGEEEEEETNDGIQIPDRESSDGSDTEDDEEGGGEAKASCNIPEWARGAPLKEALTKQFGLDGGFPVNPDTIFAEVQTCNLEEIFGPKPDKPYYKKRGSSAHWSADEVTSVEIRKYQQAMRYEYPTSPTPSTSR